MTRFLASTSILFALTGCNLVDLRPDDLKGDVSAELRADGHARVQRMFDAHGGLERWEQFETVQTTFRDEWTNWLFFQVTPYAENNQLASLEARLHHFPASRTAFLEGKGKGEVWTAQGDQVIRERHGERTQTAAWDDAFFAVFVQNPEFMIGTPLRLASADQHAYVGPMQWHGDTYEVVMVSWDTFEPQERVDQWLLYLDPATDRLVAAEFTVRMSGRTQTGFYHFHDERRTDGLMLAHAMDAYLDKDDETPVHRYRFGDFAFR